MHIAPQDGADETNISYSLVETTTDGKKRNGNL